MRSTPLVVSQQPPAQSMFFVRRRHPLQFEIGFIARDAYDFDFIWQVGLNDEGPIRVMSSLAFQLVNIPKAMIPRKLEIGRKRAP
jgi:hypothetical protein